MIWLWIWLGVIIATLVVEIATVGLTTIWMTGGALFALICAALSLPVWLQISVFIVVTAALLWFTRPWALKYLNRKRMKTNIEAIIGATVRVTEKVDNRAETGKVVYNSMEWTARAASFDKTFEVDEIATVKEVSGVKLIIE